LTEFSYIQALVDLLPDFTFHKQVSGEASHGTANAKILETKVKYLEADQAGEEVKAEETREVNTNVLEVDRTEEVRDVVDAKAPDKLGDFSSYSFPSVQIFQEVSSKGIFSGDQRNIEVWFLPIKSGDLINFNDLLLNEILPDFHKGRFQLNVFFVNFQDVPKFNSFIEIPRAFFKNDSTFCISYVPAVAIDAVAKSEPGLHLGFEKSGMIFVRVAFNR
jgi:hypothetical protein